MGTYCSTHANPKADYIPLSLLSGFHCVPGSNFNTETQLTNALRRIIPTNSLDKGLCAVTTSYDLTERLVYYQRVTN